MVKKYSCDDKFFSRETEDVFYWAGFIAADGCIYVKGEASKMLSIILSEKDLNHLEKLKNDIKYTGKIYTIQGKNSLDNPNWKDTIKKSLVIHSLQICKDLEKFGIKPRKSFTYKMPEWLINHKFINHFLRGYFDGDGSIWFHKKPSVKASIDIRGTIYFLNQLKNILEIKSQINSKVKPKISNNMGVIKFSGNRLCFEIKEFLYANSSIYLERKYDRCKEIKFTRTKYANRI